MSSAEFNSSMDVDETLTVTALEIRSQIINTNLCCGHCCHLGSGENLTTFPSHLGLNRALIGEIQINKFEFKIKFLQQQCENKRHFM